MECKQVLYKSYQCIFSDLNGCVFGMHDDI